MVKKEKDSQVFRPKVGEKIFCEHKGRTYPAKVLDSRKDPDSQDKNAEQYLVHYQGWSKNWDEWASEQRVSQFDAAIAPSKEEKDKQPKAKGASSARRKLAAQPNQVQSNISTVSSQGSASDSIKIDRDESSLQLDEEIKIKIPDELRNWLIEDDFNIKNKKLTILPARTTIATILKDFINHKKASSKSTSDKELILSELTLGIKDYFNVMLGAHLLYKFERLQYQLLLKQHGEGVDLTTHYGVTHLVRLFTRIGKPLAATSLDSQSMQTILNYIQDLLKFITKQTSLFDLDKNYTIALPDYIKNALK